MLVGSVDYVPVLEGPRTFAFRFVILEIALETGAVGVNPFALDHLTLHEDTGIFLTSLLKNVCSFAFFLAFNPVSTVEIGAFVGHYSFAVTKTFEPVTVVYSFISINLLSNT